MTMRECVACRHPLQGDICPNPSCARFCKPIANAPQVPPPDRPETMTEDDAGWLKYNEVSPYDPRHITVSPERAARILATYAALEAVKAENARLKDKLELADAFCDAQLTDIGRLRAQLAEAQKDSARFRWLAMQRWWDAGSWAPRGFTNLIDAVDAARSGRKDVDDETR